MSHLPEKRADRRERQVCRRFVVNSRNNVPFQNSRFCSGRAGLDRPDFESEKAWPLGDYGDPAFVFLLVILEMVAGVENELLVSVIENYRKAP